MHRKYLLAALPLVILLVCAIGLVMHIVSQSCVFVPWPCDERSMARDLQAMLVVIAFPLLASGAWGIWQGVRQLRATARMLRVVLALPHRPLPDTLVPIAGRLGILDRLDLVDDAGTEVFCYGLLRPRILLTTGLLAQLSHDELEAVLYHERHHLHRRDPLRSWLWTMLDALCWWAEVGCEAARLQRELAADRAAIAAGRRYALARALLKLLTAESAPRGSNAGLAITGLSVTDARIDQLVQPELAPTIRVSRAGVFLLPAVTGLAALLCSVVMATL